MNRSEKNIWIINHYAGNMLFDQGGRHYSFAKYLKRDLKARNDYQKTREDLVLDPNELYILDIIRGDIQIEK